MKGLILALDMTSAEKGISVFQKVCSYIEAVKVNYPIVLSAGTKIIKTLSEKKYVLCDFKIADIPNTSRLIAEIAFENGASGVIAHAFTGRDSLKAVKDVAEKYGGEVFVVVEMSHPGGAEFTAKHAEEFAYLAKEAGARGVIAPATRPERIKKIREIIGEEMLILSPGVGTQGGELKKTISAGANYIIVGRSIYEAEKPDEIAKEMRAAIST
ncbi:MAG: orotidine-5'-phosphate decarboxylase [Thermoplasmata archaeon]